MSERLELVTDFAQLRAGMIIVYRPCRLCGQAHRGILTGPFDGEEVETRIPGQFFEVQPRFPCTDVDGGPGPRSIAKRNVYRVIDGLEQSQATTKKRQRVK